MRPPVCWARPEPFGAWVRLEDGLLLAVDRTLAAKLGVALPENSSDEPLRPLEVHVAVTARCFAPCTGCYIDAKPDGDQPAYEQIVEWLEQIRELGASTVAVGGGEPLLRNDLGRLATAARALGLVPVTTTSGFGLTEARAETLRAFAQINVSHDGTEDGYTGVRGFDGRITAERAIELLADASIPVGVNMVLARGSLETLEETATRAASLGARELQLLRYKPAGRARGIGYYDRRIEPERIEPLCAAIKRIIEGRLLQVRIDCAMVPLLSEWLLREVERPAETLAAMGVFGCEAGRYLGAVRTDGAMGPCSFVAGTPNPQAWPSPRLQATWIEDAMMHRFRDHHARPMEPCQSCELERVCRGGCQVVSMHAGNAFMPDPECPIVRAHAATTRTPAHKLEGKA